ncbi:MAG: NADH-quinone oxidoreductase subunit M, partial [bacterium]|nr:NADH-quinone oxidoreductase subunit M [bacterium]
MAGRTHMTAARWISVAALAADLLLVAVSWLLYFPAAGGGEAGIWLMEFHYPWVPQLGIGFHLGLDGLSLLLVILAL